MSDKFPVMLASPNKLIDRINFPAIAQHKMDGMRALIVVRGEDVTVYSRNGKVMEGLGDHFKPMTNHNNMVYDGELTIIINGKELDRKTGNGILHKSVVGTISPEEIKNIVITLWDIIPLDAWESGKDSTPYHARLSELKAIPESKLHKIVDGKEVNDMSEAESLFKDILKKGGEGIILKNIDHPWEAKRSTHMVKMKEMLEIDLKVTGWQEGTGKYVGKMGALECQNKDGSIVVSVGTGFNDEHRDKFTKDYSVGKIISIQYNAVIDRKSDNIKSLFLPVFVEFRPDKEVADLG